MPTIKLAELRPGAIINPHRYSAYPYTLDIDGVRVRSVTFEQDGGISYVDSFHAGDSGKPDDPVDVTTEPPTVELSWDAEGQQWVVQINTPGAADDARLLVFLNDHDLFHGVPATGDERQEVTR